MKSFLTICVLAIAGALAAPFFLNVGGKPIMTVDEVIDDSTPQALKTPTKVYKWQDEYGRWQFGEAPPEQGQAVSIQVQDRITPMDDDWAGATSLQRSEPKPAFEAPGIAAYADGGRKLMEQATLEVEKLNERTDKMEAMRARLGQ